MMRVIGTKRVQLVTYQLNGVGRTLFDQWKKGRDEDTPLVRCAYFEVTFLGHFFPREQKESKV